MRGGRGGGLVEALLEAFPHADSMDAAMVRTKKVLTNFPFMFTSFGCAFSYVYYDSAVKT